MFIEHLKLKELCSDVIKNLEKASSSIEQDLHSNIIDPFSAIFEASFQNISLTQ